MTEEVMHPTCDICGKYIFAIDCCRGHGDKREALIEDPDRPSLLNVFTALAENETTVS